MALQCFGCEQKSRKKSGSTGRRSKHQQQRQWRRWWWRYLPGQAATPPRSIESLNAAEEQREHNEPPDCTEEACVGPRILPLLHFIQGTMKTNTNNTNQRKSNYKDLLIFKDSHELMLSWNNAMEEIIHDIIYMARDDIENWSPHMELIQVSRKLIIMMHSWISKHTEVRRLFLAVEMDPIDYRK